MKNIFIKSVEMATNWNQTHFQRLIFSYVNLFNIILDRVKCKENEIRKVCFKVNLYGLFKKVIYNPQRRFFTLRSQKTLKY